MLDSPFFSADRLSPPIRFWNRRWLERQHVHGRFQIIIYTLNIPLGRGHVLVPQNPLNRLGTDLMGIS